MHWSATDPKLRLYTQPTLKSNILEDNVTTGLTLRTTEVGDMSQQNHKTSVSFSTDIATGRHSSDEKFYTQPTLKNNILKDNVTTGRTLQTTEVDDMSQQNQKMSISFSTNATRGQQSSDDKSHSQSKSKDYVQLPTTSNVTAGRTLRTTEVDNVNNEDRNLIESIVDTCNAYYHPTMKPTIESVRRVLTDAYISTVENYGIKEANEWADGFEIPTTTVLSDMKKFCAAGLDFKVMVRRQISLNAANRLSKDRVDRLHPNNPEKSKLYDLANGMVVPHCPSFVPNSLGKTTPPRELYLKVHNAVDKMLFALHEQGLAFILPEAAALKHIPNLNCCKAHWARKKGKKSGRPIGDLSNGDGTPLNSDYAKNEAEVRWGKINHPTIEDFILMIFELLERISEKDPSMNWDDLVIWTMDLAGAYTLLSFRPDNAHLMGMTLSDRRVFIFLCGVFGWTGTPAAFQVVTRA